MPARKKITDTPDGPKPKRVMTPEQLEKLAAAREKAKAVKDAMKSENDEHKIRILQAKMDAIKKTSKKKPDPPEPVPDLEEDMRMPLVPEPEQMTEPEPLQEDKLPSVPEEEPEPPEPPAKPAPAKTAKPKKGKKPVVIVDESNSDTDSDDNSNVIYIRRKKKKQGAPPPPSPAPPQMTPQERFAPANPFFTYNWSHKNFQ